jgi:large subunit ribosomal protein L35
VPINTQGGAFERAQGVPQIFFCHVHCSERETMPKMKPHSGMRKRVRVTGKGKIVSEQAGKRHLLEGKSSKRTRRLTGTVELAPAERKRINKLLGR